MVRIVSLANAGQAAIYALAWYWLRDRWSLTANLAMICAALQLIAGGALLLRKERLARWCSVACLALVGLVVGQFLDAADHLTEAYGVDAKKLGERSRQTVWLATPWVVFFPLWQSLHGGLKTLILPASLVFLPILFGTGGDGPLQRWPAQDQQGAATVAAFSLWHGKDAVLPTGVGPATVLLTPYQNGRAGRAVRGDGTNLAEAIKAALVSLPEPTGDRTALVLDVARKQFSHDAPVPAGDGGGLDQDSGSSSAVAWRPGRMGSKTVAPGWAIPVPKIGKQFPVLFDGMLADDSGVYALRGAWTSPPELSAKTALEAAVAGGKMLMHHQQSDGRFAYTVEAPSGKPVGKGYNFPRHAGTAWFLARLAKRTNDPEILAAANRSIDFMVANSIVLDPERSYFGAPRRRDGMAWVGTTALAGLAANAVDRPIALQWGRFVASSVGTNGQVRGELKREEGVFLDQKKNPYGQGQTTLAIAALVRSGHEEFRPTLDQLAQYLDGDYAPGGVGRLIILDEHWTCLAALAIQDVTGQAAGAEICHAYLSQGKNDAPSAESRIRPFSGSAGGHAEAVVAGAFLERSYREEALAYGQWFLQSAYIESDASLLPVPRALIGGFRDTPYQLDVRMDAVQHIGCALLGIEALLGQLHPGALP